MSIVTLVSGGVDSAIIALMAKEAGLTQFPLFISYGQLSFEKEWEACQQIHEAHGLPEPKLMDLSGFGGTISSGLTDPRKEVFEDAFLPGRNLLFLTVGASYAYQVDARSVAIGLLREDNCIFPDQTRSFIEVAQAAIAESVYDRVSIVAPLMEMSKREVMKVADQYGIETAYSCHAGTDLPCGKCISCRERKQ